MIYIPIRIKFFRIVPDFWIMPKQVDWNNGVAAFRKRNTIDGGGLNTLMRNSEKDMCYDEWKTTTVATHLGAGGYILSAS